MKNIREKGISCVKAIHVFGLILTIVASVLVAFPSSSFAASDPDTITIAWLPNNSVDSEKTMRDEIARVISQATGKKVENKVTTDYVIAIKALETGDAQLGWFGPFEYMSSHAKYPNVVPLAVESGDSGTLKDAMYHSRILVKKGNEDQYRSGGEYSLDNIVGKRMSFVSTSSTSGFNMPSAAIRAHFSKQARWKNLSREDLTQGGNGQFFSQVVFAGSHQLSLVNLLIGRVDVAAVDDADVAQYVHLTSGEANTAGAVYTVNTNAAAPFNSLAGAQFVVIKPIAVLNTPWEANNKALSQKTIDEITQALTAEQVAKDPKIFAAKGTPGSFFVQPHRFVKVDDSWYNPMRTLLGIQ